MGNFFFSTLIIFLSFVQTQEPTASLWQLSINTVSSDNGNAQPSTFFGNSVLFYLNNNLLHAVDIQTGQDKNFGN